MRRLDSSEISQAKRRRPGRRKPDSADAPAVETPVAPPQEPFDQILGRFAADVESHHQKSPYLAAYDRLVSEENGVVPLLSLEAADLFSQARADNPADAIALHHLAIIHHGYAIHLHRGSASGDLGLADQAIEHWRLGLASWAELVKQDKFWETLRTRWQTQFEATPDDKLIERLANKVDFDRLRRALPEQLLDVHLTVIEKTYEDQPQIAKSHLQLIVTSEFDKKHIENVRHRLYKSLVGNVGAMCADLRFSDAEKRLLAYLKIDSDYTTALTDRLMVVSKDCERMENDTSTIEKRIQMLQRCEATAKHSALRQASEEMIVADSLRRYYHQWAMAHVQRANRVIENSKNVTMQQVLQCVDHLIAASKYTRQAVKFERGGDRARRLHFEACNNGAMLLLNNTESYAKAKSLLDASLEVDSQDPLANVLLAKYYFEKGETTQFKRQLEVAERINSTACNPTATSQLENLRTTASRGTGGREFMKLLVQAAEYLKSKNFHGALAVCKRAEQYVGSVSDMERSQLYKVMAICCLETGDLHAGKRYFEMGERAERGR